MNWGPFVWIVLRLFLPGSDEAQAPTDLVKWRTPVVGHPESIESGRPVLYFFTADWCPPCDALKRNVFSDPELAEFIERRFVPVEVNDPSPDPDDSPADVRDLRFRFMVGRIPTLVVARVEGGPALSEEGVPVYSRMARFIRTAPTRFQAMEDDYRARARVGEP